MAGLSVPQKGVRTHHKQVSLYCHETGAPTPGIHEKLHTVGGFALKNIYECNCMPNLDAWFMFESIATGLIPKGSDDDPPDDALGSDGNGSGGSVNGRNYSNAQITSGPSPQVAASLAHTRAKYILGYNNRTKGDPHDESALEKIMDDDGRKKRIHEKVRKKYAQIYQANRRSLVPCGRAGNPARFAKVASSSRGGGGGSTGGARGNLSPGGGGDVAKNPRPYEIALHLRLGDLLINRTDAMSNIDFSERVRRELYSFSEAFATVLKVQTDLQNIPLAAPTSSNALMPPTSSAQGEEEEEDVADRDGREDEFKKEDNKNIGMPKPDAAAVRPIAHVLIMSDSPLEMVQRQLMSHQYRRKNMTIEVLQKWNDGVSDLTTCKITKNGISQPIIVDFLTSGNPLVALHCLSSADMLVGATGNFVSLAATMALGPPQTHYIPVGAKHKWRQRHGLEHLDDVLKRVPAMLLESDWHEDTFGI